MAKQKAVVPVAVVLTDTHLDENNASTVKSVMIQACELAFEHRIKDLLHMGDIFHNRKGQTQPNLTAFEEHLDVVESYSLNLHAVPGNHDKTDYRSHKSFLSAYRHHPSFQLYDFPTEIRLNVDSSLRIVMAPFFAEGEYVEHMNEAKLSAGSILLTHIGIDGAVMNNGVTVASAIKQSFFKDFSRVYIGHYHDPAEYGNCKYIGASIQHNYGEGPRKGAHLLMSDGSLRFQPLKFPEYLAYEINADNITAKDIKDFEEERKLSGNNLRIVLTGSEASIKGFDSQRLKNVGIDVKKKQDDIIKEEVEHSVEAFTDLSLLSAFSAFCKKNELIEEDGLKYLKQDV
jgi:exonuclease SbcD